MFGSKKTNGLGAALILLTASVSGLAASSAAHAALTYTVSTELKKPSCSGDTDSDCLDNVEEGNLAWAAAPWYFYDENEDCSGYRNNFGVPASHFARQDFFQVRPEGGGIRDWVVDGQAKWVKISYFFNHPHDCGAAFGAHQGDSEHVRLELYSYDLRTWYLYQAYYAHHDRDQYFTGTYLEERAQALGTNWITVAADADSHGSWPGLEPGGAACAGAAETAFCNGNCACFVGTWQEAVKGNAGREVIAVTRNIGGPAPEQWNQAVVTVSGGQAYTDLDVGHGVNREYWSTGTGAASTFCGWECPSGSRNADGTCAVAAHGQTACSAPLSSKVDASGFQIAPGSCAGHCGGSVAGCFCDANCSAYGDCCADACSACGSCGGNAKAQNDSFFAPAAPSEPARQQTGDPKAALPASAAVGKALPQLRGVEPGQQLQTLRWMLASGDDTRLIFLFSDLRDQKDSLPARATTARQRLEELAVDLERAGYTASEPVEAARIDPNAPPPSSFPASVLEALGLNRDGSPKTSGR